MYTTNRHPSPALQRSVNQFAVEVRPPRKSNAPLAGTGEAFLIQPSAATEVKPVNYSPLFAQRCLAISSASGLAIASAGFGAVFAWSQGSQHGVVLGCLSVIMAVALETAKPLAVAGMLSAGREWKLGHAGALMILAAVAISYSLTAELQLMARSRSDAIAERAGAAQHATDARAARDRARTELDKLGTVARSADEIAPVIAAKLSDKRLEDCNGKWLETAKLRATCIEVANLKSELARAQRHDELRREVDKAEAALMAAGGSRLADPGATALASYLATLGVKVDPGKLGDWLVLVAVLSLEAGSALGGLLLRAVQSAPIPLNAQPIQCAPALSCETPASTGVQVGVQPLYTSALNASRQRVLEMLKASGGSVQTGQRALAKTLGVSPARTNQLLRAMAADGLVKLRVGSTGTLVSLAA